MSGPRPAGRQVRATALARLLAGALALAALAGCGRDLEDLGVVLDLVGSLPVAETYREVDVIELGTPLAAEHLLWGWSWNEREPTGDGGETAYTWGLGDSSGLRFYLSTRRDLHLELRGRAGPTPPDGLQVVTVEVNGETVDRVRLEPHEAGWVTYPVAVPRELLATGWNTLVLDYRHAMEPREAGLSGDRRSLAVAWDRIRLEPARHVGAGEPEAPAPDLLRLPLGTEVAYYAPLPGGSVLALDGLGTTGETSRLLVRLQWEGEDPIEVASLGKSKRPRVLELPGPSSAAQDGPRLARLSLRAAPSGWLEARAATAEGFVEVVAPRVLAPAQKPAPDEETAAPEPPDHRPDVLVYVIDTLRADRVGAYEPAAARQGPTPAIDAFAEGAVLFEDALTQAPWTRPAVASVLTGLPPLAHGVTTLEDRLPRDAVTLPEVLRDLPGGGYRTAAWSTSPHVVRTTGLAQGFQDFHYLPQRLRPEAVNRRVLGWIDRHLETAGARPEEPRPPVFLYVHALDDRGFGRLLAALEERGLREETLIVLLAAHGEASGEHGALGHGNDLSQETLRIPLIVDLPGREAGRLAGTALPMDVPATVLAALGVPKPPQMAGADLLGPERERAARPAFAHLDHGGRAGVSVVLGDWKLVEPLTLRFGRAPELYHLGRDPEERENLAESRPVRTGYLRSLVRRHLLEAGAGGR